MEHSYAFRCGSHASSYLTALAALAYLYKFVLHAVGLVLAFQTRNIKVDVLNDYRYNSAIIIASSLLIVVILLFMFDGLLWSGIPLSVIIFSTISLYLGLTFLPKVCTDHYKNKLMKTQDKYHSHK